MVFNATFNNISVIPWVAVSFIGGGNPGNPGNTCHKSLTKTKLENKKYIPKWQMVQRF
jgi:hypothetical protein